MTKRPMLTQWWIFRRFTPAVGRAGWEWWDECMSRRDGLRTLKQLRADAEEPGIWKLGRVEAWKEDGR